jgi:hypothetical protein
MRLVRVRVQLRGRAVTRRLAVIDAYEFPSGIRSRFSLGHQSLSAEDVRVVEAGARQWFRLVARQSKAKLAMPSVIVGDMWRELVLHTRDYAEFCEIAFGGLRPYVTDAAALGGTYRLAVRDEPDAPGRLPLLFRVDAELGVGGGSRYLADCGGRGQCHEMPGTVCLQHIDGLGRPFRGRWKPSSQRGHHAG